MSLYRDKFCKTILTYPRFHDTLYSKSCRKSGGSHRDNHHFQRMIAQKERTAPQHTRSFCRCFTRQNPSPVLRRRYFSFLETSRGEAPPSCCARPFRCLKAPLGLSLLRCACKRKPYLENFMSRPNVIPAFQPTSLQNGGRNFVRVSRRFYIRVAVLYLFLRLNNSEITVRNVF